MHNDNIRAIVPELDKRKVVISNLNMDGVPFALAVADTGLLYRAFYVDGYQTDKVLSNIMPIIEKDTDIQEILLVNLKLSTSMISRLNRLVSAGVKLFYYGYLFNPTGLDGVIKVGHNYVSLVGYLEDLKYLNKHGANVNIKRTELYSKWATLAMKYEGDDKLIESVTESFSIVREFVSGINPSVHTEEIHALIKLVFDKCLSMAKSNPAPYIFYNGRRQIMLDVTSKLNLGPSYIDRYTIPMFVLFFLRKSIVGVNIDLANRKGLVYDSMPHFDQLAKSELANDNVDFVINVKKMGYVQIRTKDTLNAKTIAASLAHSTDEVGFTRAYGCKVRRELLGI